MDTGAHYVTQSGFYDCPKLGRLTNRRIAKYQKQGVYGRVLPGTVVKKKRDLSQKHLIRSLLEGII